MTGRGYQWANTVGGAVDYLNARPAQPPAFTQTPNPRPDEYVRVLEIDGYRVDDRNGWVEATVLAVEGWARTPGRARRIVNDARRALHEAEDNAVEFDGQVVRKVVEQTTPVRRTTGEEGRHMSAFNVAIHQRH